MVLNKKIPTKSITVRASEGRVTRVKLNEDGDLIFTCGSDGLICVWSVITGDRLGTYHYNADCCFGEDNFIMSLKIANGAIFDFDINRGCTELAAVKLDVIIIWEATTGRVLDSIGFNGIITSIEFNRDVEKQNKFLVARSGKIFTNGEPEIYIYECDDLHPKTYAKQNRNWQRIRTLKGLTSDPTFVRWGPLDQSIICGTENGNIIIWDLDSKMKICKQAHNNAIKDVSFNKDRSVMLTVSRDKTAKLWNTADLSLIETYCLDRPLNACSLSPLIDSETGKNYYHVIIAGGQDAGEVTTSSQDAGLFETIILDLITKEEIARITAHFSPTLCLKYLKNGKGFVTGAYEGNCKIIQLPNSFFNAISEKKTDKVLDI